MAQVDARQQTEDLHDAVTWLLKHPLVDETKIALWGLCFGGNVNLAAAAFEYVVSIFTRNLPRWFSFPLFSGILTYCSSPSDESPHCSKRVSASILMPALERLGVPVENRISVQTYHRSLSWNILNLVQYFSPTPAMMVTPEFDMSCPTSEQLECFKMMKEPKELDILKGKGHIDWIFGDIENVLSRQLDFLQRRLNF